jgi:C-terminal peptidase prc
MKIHHRNRIAFVAFIVSLVLATFSPAPSPALAAPQPAPTQSPRQLRVFQRLWKIVNDNYIYPNFGGVDWAAKKIEIEAQIAAGMDDSTFYLTLRRLIASLNDQHSVYLPPFVAEEIFELYFNTGDYEGVGLITDINRERRYLYVLQVLPGSAAEKAGIRPHDRILTIGGYQAVDRDGYSQSFLLNGPAGSPVALTVQTPEGATRSFDVVRERLPSVELVDERLLPNTDNKKIGYLFIPTFFSETIDKKARASLQQLMKSAGGKLDGLVIDVRTNSGGSIVALGNILGLFAKGNLGRFSTRKGPKGSLVARGENIGNSQTVPIVVLISPDSVSAAEIFAGALQGKGRARLVGQPSAGNIEGLRTYIFEDGSILFIAEQRFTLTNGFNWEGQGLQPIITAGGKWDDISVDNDPALIAATNLLLGK